MPAKVFCRKYQQELQGMVAPPFPGPRGLDIFNNVSLKAWQEWQAHQVRLINEKQLTMANPEHRKFLQQHFGTKGAEAAQAVLFTVAGLRAIDAQG